MNSALVITMDLGRFKAFRMESSPARGTPRLVPVEDRETNVESHLSDQLSDQAGQFGKGARSFGPVNDMASGERHNIDLELRRRAIKEFARLTGELIEREKADTLYFAASSEINQQMIDAMDQSVRRKIGKNVKANLTRMDAGAIIEHFSSPQWVQAR